MSAHHNTKIDPAEFKRGYKVLLVSIVGVITSGAVSPLYTFGPFVQPLQQAFGWSRGDVQSAMTFFFIGLMLSSLVAAWLIARLGLRTTGMISAIGLAVGYALMTLLTPSVWTLYAGYFLLPMIAAGTQMVTWTQLVSLWFVKNRGLALALVLTGTGLCTLLITPQVARIVANSGWQSAYLFLAVLPVLITLPLIYFWMPNQGPALVAETPATAAATSHPANELQQRTFSTPQFWIITFGLACTVIGILGMLTNAVPLMIDNGIAATTAASIFGSYGIALIVGRMSAGYLIDRLWAPGVAFVTLTLPAIGCVIFALQTSNTLWLVLASLLIGIGAGAEFDFASFLVARYFGVRHYSRNFSVFYAVSTLFTCITPFVFGRIYDVTGSYQTMLWICTACFLVGPSLLLFLGPYPEMREQ